MADGQVAIVTGASRGIGAAVAERLAADGMAVAINYTGSSEDAQKVADRLGSASKMVVQANVSDPAAVASMFDKVGATLGPGKRYASFA